MSAAAAVVDEVVESEDQPTPGDLRLCEAVSLVEGAVQPDGTVLVHIIRPGLGRGKGKHYYGPDMLRENAHVFTGWKMYVDHESEQARRAAGGLPRSIRDLGGRILETWWDESVPADDLHEAGAVVGRVRPVKFVRELVEDDPELLETSINANATAVRSHNHGGIRCWLVEGIRPKGTLDWVTEAGAGGKVVAALQEAYSERVAQSEALLDAMNDDEVAEYVRANRQGLMESFAGPGGGGKPEDDTSNPNGGAVADEITPELLREALSTPEAAEMIAGIARQQAEVFATEGLDELVEARVAEEREVLRAEARGEFQREMELRDMQTEAYRLIEGAIKHPDLAARAKDKFSLTADGPTEALDVIEEIDAEGAVTKSAMDVLRESVQTEIDAARELLASVNKTRVRGQGNTKLTESLNGGGGSGGGERKLKPTTGSPLTDELLVRAGIDKDALSTVYAGTAS